MLKYSLIFIMIFIAGCATTNTEVVPAVVNDKAVVFVKNTFLNYPKANGSIRKIDSEVKSTSLSWGGVYKVEIAPGNHSIEVAFYSKGIGFQGVVSGQLDAGEIYEVVGKYKEDKTYTISLHNIGPNEDVPLSVVEVEGNWAP